MDEDSQWNTLREKFVSVVEPVIASSDENNITTLLSSLSHIYRPIGGITVPLTHGSTEEVKAIEFTCWLISQLLNIHNSLKVHEAVCDLLTNIFHLIGIKNPNIFPDIIEEFLAIGKNASDILFGENDKVHQCFKNISDKLTLSAPSLKAKQLHFKNDESLDQLLCKIVAVIGNISDDLLLYGTRYVDEAWYVIALTLEAGDLYLKSTAMKTFGLMLVSCKLTNFIERQDYLLQLIGGCLVSSIKGDFEGPEINGTLTNSLESNLCFAISKLNEQLPRIHPCLALDVLESVGEFLNYSNRFHCISGALLKETLNLTYNLLELYPGLMQASITQGTLEKAISQNLRSKEVIEVYLKKFIFRELEDIYPKCGLPENVRKRNFQESENEFTSIRASSVSKWWAKVEEEMQSLLETLSSEVDFKEYIHCVDTFISYLKLASDLIAMLPEQNSVSIAFLSENILSSLTEIIFAIISQMSSLPKVLKTLSLLHHLIFISNVSKTFNSDSSSSFDMHHLWVSLASLPWLANEVKWLDLKTPNMKLVVSIVAKSKWSNDCSMKTASLPILASTLKNIAPLWRSHILRSILKEGNTSLINCVAEWLPMFLQHLPLSSSQSLLGDALGKIFSSQDPNTLKIFSKTLNLLYCSILNMTRIKPKEGSPCCANSLSCNFCQNSNGLISDGNRSNHLLDQALVQRFFGLTKSLNIEIVLNFINSLPAVISHSNISPNMFTQLLDLLLHESEAVIDAFCQKLPLFFLSNKNEEKNPKEVKNDKMDLLLSHLEKMIVTADNSDREFFLNQLAVIKVFNSLARKKLLPLTNSSLLLLMKCLVSPDQEISARAHLFVSEWSRHLSISPKELYLKNKRRAAQILSEFLREGEVAIILSHFAEVFCWSSSADGKSRNVNVCSVYATSQLPYLLPPLVIRANSDNKPTLLLELSTCVGTRLRDMIIDHFQHILSYIVCNCNAKEKESILQFISTTTDIEIQQIRKCSVQNQVNELIMGLHDHRDTVLKEFIAMQAIENETTPKDNQQNFIRNVAQFLAPRLLGILGFLDGKLVSTSTAYREKQAALLSLSDLLLIMGKEHVSPVALKVLASLKTALKIKNSDFLEIACQAWTSYLQSLDESTLEGIFEEVIIIILPLIKEKPQEMASILQKIIMETESMKSLLKNLPLLPSHPSLLNINEAVKEAQQTLQVKSPESLVEVLRFIHKGLSHDSIDVKQHYLHRLKNILTHNQTNVHHLILDSDKVHEVVSKVYYALLDMCREGEQLHILVAECFGLFGAIDSARLIDVNDKEKAFVVYSDIESEVFVHDLVMEIARDVMSATDTQTQTCALYAMQEILRLYKIGASSRNERTVGSAVYASLPSNVQEILLPLHSSKYTISSNSSKASANNLPCPVYGTKYSLTFNHWLTNWVCSLIDLLIGERAKQVFSSCKPVMRRDATTAMELLSPLLVSVLTESFDNHPPILTEILAIISEENISASQLNDSENSLSCNSSKASQSSKKLQHLAAQTIFSCLDYVNRWAIIEKEKQINPKSRIKHSFSVELQRVLEFLDKIPSNTIAKISFKFQAYSRSLRNLELYLDEFPEQKESNLTFLQSIYVALDEPDGVAGVAAIRPDEPTLNEQIIEHEAKGCLHDALACYERLCTGESSEESYKRMLRCYLSLDQPQSVLNITQGLIFRESHLASKLNEFRVEAAWRLGQWDQLEEFLKTENSPSWGVGVGKVLLAARDRNVQEYATALKDLRIQQITPLSVASMELGAFQRASPCILRLQILNELEEMLTGLLKIPLANSGNWNEESNSKVTDHNHLTLEELKTRWDQRLSLVQTSHRCLETLLNFRRTLLQIGRDWSKNTNDELSLTLSSQLESTWLHSAKIARKSGLLQQGEWAFFGAGHGRDVFMERAKWYWMKGEQHQAVATLKRGIDKFFPNIEKLKEIPGDQESKQIASQAKLLLARYSEESSIIDVNTVKKFYRESCDINKQWEDGHFHLAMYYDRLLSNLDVKDKPSDWLFHIVQSFGRSLTQGCKHLYQSMPRLLSIWLDFGAKVAQMDSRKNEKYEVDFKKLKEMNTYMELLLERLPYYAFLIALPQLISRICHSRDDVFQVLKQILSRMLCQYPQQAMWHMIQVSKSSYEVRRTRCVQVFELAKKSNPSLAKFTADATKLADLFIELSNKHIDKGTTNTNINIILRALPRTLSDPKFSNIILPLHNQITVTLPSSYGTGRLQDLIEHKPFPSNEIYLSGIEDHVEIMQSLISPKKITLRGSDGNLYSMMCKPKDDMRKDCRLMEFNSFLNRLLTRDPDSRKRNLKIRTYIVVPLNEECGLIEWVPNLCGLRHVIFKYYRRANKYMSGTELKKYMVKITDPLEHKRNVYVNQLLPRHPPLLKNWFLETFFDPQTWLRARMSYSRTTAVMSMVGYILGLGDRHGENILLDSSSGDIVHVDFNCLFNKGESLDYPEKVPFRLTHNMVNAMGPSGYEGVFRKAAEVTMRVMRNEREELMSVLKPFVHDPLVEWEKPDKSVQRGKAASNVMTGGEINNVRAQKHVQYIEERLAGQINTKSRGVQYPLSVEGQVDVLIEEATSIDNLCQMYIGWAAFM